MGAKKVDKICRSFLEGVKTVDLSPLGDLAGYVSSVEVRGSVGIIRAKDPTSRYLLRRASEVIKDLLGVDEVKIELE